MGTDPAGRDQAIAILLLEDLHEIFNKASDVDLGSGQTVRRLTTRQVIGRLEELEDRPWQSYLHGRKLNGQQLAALLRPFGITPKVLWFPKATSSARGYENTEFTDVFKRYLGAGEDS